MITCAQVDIYVTVYNKSVYNIICEIIIKIIFLDVGPAFDWSGAALQNPRNTITIVTLNSVV